MGQNRAHMLSYARGKKVVNVAGLGVQSKGWMSRRLKLLQEAGRPSRPQIPAVLDKATGDYKPFIQHPENINYTHMVSGLKSN